MRKRIISFYDALLFAIVGCSSIITAAILLFTLITKGTSEWIYENWYLVLIFAIAFMASLVGMRMVRYCVINDNSIHFHYFPFTISWEKAANNIDVRWNQNVLISEIKDIEIIKLTEEKQINVYYKHWFNKYLKFNMKYGNPKYVYVGNYSNNQIEKIIKLAENN